MNNYLSSTKEREQKIRKMLKMQNGDLSFTVITPEIARTILAGFNDNNRKLSIRVAENYANDIRRGRWRKSNDNITFDDDWMLSNGQHRLKAITLANRPLAMVAQFHVNQNCEIDRGKQRTISENIRLSNGVTNVDLASDGQIHRMVNTALRTLGTDKSYRTDDVIDVINKYEKELLEVREAGLLRGASGVGQAAIPAAMFVAYINGVELGMLTHIRTVLNDGMTGDDKDKPIIGLRDKLMAIRGGGGSLNAERAKYTQYCINAMTEGKTTKTCKCNEFYYKLK